MMLPGKYLILGLSLLMLACQQSSDQSSNSKLKVITTTTMIADAVANVGGDSLEVTALMGPGVDPHLYKATQGDLKKLRNADLVFYNGLLLEGKMGEVLEKLGRIKPVTAVSSDINPAQLLNSPLYENAYDPHIWFDVALWKQAVAKIAGTLQELDPGNAGYYRQNADNYLKRLDSLHQQVLTEIAQIPYQQRVLITAHDAFEYFGRAYDIEVRGLQGLSTLTEFGLKDITDLVQFIMERNIRAVFIETSISERSIQAVVEGCQNQGHDVRIGGSLFSDAMGAKNTPEGTYIGMVNANVRTITQALK
ncbi:MAG: manganese-binding lipoprotein MntA [Cyclobacteriaceae bacterium]|nr:MAG: manganese-binding lipoprotein MntA [Cyclobacteriaceae bacterium]